MFKHIQIKDRQNEAESILFIRAQRKAYSIAKNYYLFRMALSILWPILAIIIFINFEKNTSNLILIISSIIVVLTFSIEYFEKYYTRLGAVIQEQFDTMIFDIKWNEPICGEKIKKEVILQLAQKEKTKEDLLKDWYSGIEDDENSKFILKAQRMNVSWTSQQKKIFSKILLLLFLLSLISITTLGIMQNLLLSEYFILLFFPSLSLFLYLAKGVIDFYQQFRDLDRLNTYICNLQNKKHVTIEELRKVQDSIFIYGRVPNNIIPDKLYWKLRESFEKVFKQINDDN